MSHSSNFHVTIHVTVDGLHHPKMNLKFRSPPTYQEVKDVLVDRHGRLSAIQIKDGSADAFDMRKNDVLELVDANLPFQYRCVCEREIVQESSTSRKRPFESLAGEGKQEEQKQEEMSATEREINLLLEPLGGTTSSADFRQRGIEVTRLRHPMYKNLKLLGREESVASLLGSILHAGDDASKMPIITVPGGPGQGKTELISRMIENWDTHAAAYNESVNEAGGGALLPTGRDCFQCGVSFNYETSISLEERSQFGKLRVELAYQLLIGFRLIYTWLYKNEENKSYANFFMKAMDEIEKQKLSMESFLLLSVLRLLEQRSGCRLCVLFIDESTRPLTGLFGLDAAQQGALFTTVAGIQTLERVVVFTSLEMVPFRVASDASARPVTEVPLRRLSHEESVQLIQDMAAVRVGSSHPASSSQDAVSNIALQFLARWAGGSPKFCKQAFFAHFQKKLHNPVLETEYMYNWVKNTYLDSYKIPEVAVLLAVVGAVLRSTISCRFRDPSSVVDLDGCFGHGILSRDAKGRIFMQPILLRLFCDWYDPAQPDLPASHTTSSGTKASAEDVKETELLSEGPISSSAGVALAREVQPLVTSFLPGGEGKKFELFDRLSFRVLRVARTQLAAAVERQDVTFTAASSRSPVNASDVVPSLATNWAEASLFDIFREPRYNTLSRDLQTAKFDVSAPFRRRDKMYQSLPHRDDQQWTVERLTSRQFYPESKSHAGSDWFQVLRRSGDDSGDKSKLMFVYTENKFSTEPTDRLSNTINAQDDIVKKQKQVADMLAEAGWIDQPFVFRLAAFRYCPKFQQKTLEHLPENVLVYGPEEVESGMSPTLLDIFTCLREMDFLK